MIEFGRPESLFRDYVFHHDADLVVFGTHGRHAVFEALIGSTAKDIVSMLPCDALIVATARSRPEPRVVSKRVSPDRSPRAPPMLLGLISLLPFLGSLCAAFLPSNARNAASALAGAVALACVLMLAALHPAVAHEGVVRVIVPWLPRIRAQPVLAHRRLRLAIRDAGDSDGRAGLAVCALLPIARRSRTTLLLLSAGIHGRDVGHRAIGQPDSTGNVLGADQPHLVHAHRILVSPRGGPRRGAHGTPRDCGRRVVPAGGRTDARTHRWQLRPGSCADGGGSRSARTLGIRRFWC